MLRSSIRLLSIRNTFVLGLTRNTALVSSSTPPYIPSIFHPRFSSSNIKMADSMDVSSPAVSSDASAAAASVIKALSAPKASKKPVAAVEEAAEPEVEKPVPEGFKVIREGKARILAGIHNEVFYNNAQVVNRDLSVVAIKVFDEMRRSETIKKRGNPTPGVMKDLRILEGLSATGLRAIRYAKEIPRVESITANDLDAEAVETIKKNVLYNDVPLDKVIPNHGDANSVMYMHREPEKQFHVVDLDPYGSASIFLDPAVQAVADGGLLCVTCTDSAVLCGSHPETCYAKYGVMSIHGKHCHEYGLRVVLTAIQTAAARYKRYIVPMVSLAIDFYVRIFVRVYTSADKVKLSASNLSYLYHCGGCESWHTQPVGKAIINGNSKKFTPSHGPTAPEKCDQCGSRFQMGGPIWTQPIHSPDFLERARTHLDANRHLFAAEKRVYGLLTAAQEELNDVPLYYVLSSLSSKLHSSCPPMATVKSALINAGYRVSGSHSHPEAIKTNAPNSAIWDVMRCWIKEHPIKNKTPNTPGFHILAKEPTLQADFTLRKEGQIDKSVVRFMVNPEANWGPKPRARGAVRPAKGEAASSSAAVEADGSEEVQQVEVEAAPAAAAAAAAPMSDSPPGKRARVEEPSS